MSFRNAFRTLVELIGNPPLQVGDVSAVSDGLATVDLPGGGQVLARGAATVGDRVFVQGHVIQGEAPVLPVDLIEI